jgi:peptidylprolyl isomerase
MSNVKAGDTVKIHYTGKLEDGTVFATSRNDQPMEFTVGAAEIIPGLQEAVIGMSVGQTRTQLIPPERAYGPYHEQMTATLDRKMAPPELEIGVGVSLRVKHADGHESDVTVTELSETKMTVDGNHPLAGKNLLLEIELLDIVSC